MSFPDLRTFIEHLRRSNDIVYVDAPVNPVEEAAEIHRRVIAANGPAIVFRNVIGADFPLVTNLFGTARRAELAFDLHAGARGHRREIRFFEALTREHHLQIAKAAAVAELNEAHALAVAARLHPAARGHRSSWFGAQNVLHVLARLQHGRGS